MKTTIAIFLATVFLAGGFFGGYFLAPDKIVEVEVEVEKIVIVEKIVEVVVEKIVEVEVEKIVEVEVERERTAVEYILNPTTFVTDMVQDPDFYEEADNVEEDLDGLIDWFLG